MRIAITGMGVVSAIGNNVAETLTALREERGGIMPVNYPVIGEQLVGCVRSDNHSLAEELKIKDELPRSVLLGVKAAREALSMAGTGGADILVNGTTVGGMDLTESRYPDLTESVKDMHLAGRCSELIARHVGMESKAITVSTACSSALNSIITACNLILSRSRNRVLAGGTECLTLFHQRGFRSLGIVDDSLCKPFDVMRNGLNLGEGAAYLLLESEEEAVTRGAHILGYVSGYGNACDAYHQTASSPDGEGAFLAMGKALELSGLKPVDIDYINAHGTATQNNDQSESAAIRRLFGGNCPSVSSTKGFTGHTTSACGAIECVISLLALNHGFIPANLNYSSGGDGMIKPDVCSRESGLRHVMCNSFGFGGNDSSVIISSHPCRQMESIPSVSVDECIRVCKCEGDDYSRWLKPMEARRMTPQMRSVTAAACEALEKAGIVSPDAIITNTSLGLIVNSVRILDAMVAGEEVKPSLFMLSTHNSISSMLAIRFGCHGYNSTFCGDAADALCEAECLIAKGEARNVMLVEFEECEGVWRYPAKAEVRILHYR